MTYTAVTTAEADAIACKLREFYRGADWTVTIVEPLFVGDLYQIVVE